jgi:1-acyl-sn-glycerol-3-phosphate acyltransferase
VNLERAHELARTKGVNPIVYWVVRAILQPFFHLYFRLERIGREHIPSEGPALIAGNHRSFSDPFLLGVCLRRPLRFVAKQELFDSWWKARLLIALGAFPIERGESDEQAMETARIILERGGVVGIFPEGTRVRPGPLAQPKRGVGRLALETGAPIVPAAIVGTEDIRKGWRIRPRKVRVRLGRPVDFPRSLEPNATPNLAREVTARVWACVELQWEWLGGVAPIRTAAVVGAGSWGTAAAVLLARGGAKVQLGCRTQEQAALVRERRTNDRYLPGVQLPGTVEVTTADALALDSVDLVCLAVPSRALEGALAQVGSRVPDGAGVLVLTKGLVAPHGELPCEYASRALDRPVALLGGPAHAREACTGEAGFVVASPDGVFGAQLRRVLELSGHPCEQTDDVVGVQLAGCAKNAAALAAGIALPRGVNAAGAAAGRVYGECYRLASTLDARDHSFAGLAGTGDLVATVLADHSRNRRAGELLAAGATISEVERELGQVSEALDLVPLLAKATREAGIKAPAIAEVAALIEDRGRRGDAPAWEARAA